MSNEQQQEAFTNAEYCYVDEPGHTGGWTCRHPEHAYPEPAKHCEWPDTGRDKDRYFGDAINPIQWNWW